MRRLYVFNCDDCGQPTARQRHPHQPLVCLECGIVRAVNAAVELSRAKATGWPPEGKYTREQFAAPMRARWQRLGRRGAR